MLDLILERPVWAFQLIPLAIFILVVIAALIVDNLERKHGTNTTTPGAIVQYLRSAVRRLASRWRLKPG